MMRFIMDDSQWHNAWLDTPFGSPGGLSKEEAFKTPGCCVLARDPQAEHQFGRLVTYSEDRIVVRGYGDSTSKRFVWTGTKAEYYRTWEID
jgi:hypothetical protein